MENEKKEPNAVPSDKRTRDYLRIIVWLFAKYFLWRISHDTKLNSEDKQLVDDLTRLSNKPIPGTLRNLL